MDPTIPATPPPRPSSDPRTELRVVFSVGTFSPPVVVLGARPVAIGRDADAPDAIILADPRVSHLHAIVERDGPGWAVVDQKSRNGLWVNGERAARAPLNHGTVLRIGSTLLLAVTCSNDLGDKDDANGVLVGPSSVVRTVRAEIRLVAPRNVPVLISGDTGVGKELVAREIHRRSGRKGRFVPLNCAAVPAALAENELFGHQAGAFTGAVRGATGLFDAARGGTLFLDEIGELSVDVQPKLLRVLALGEVRPVGGSEANTVDVRVVAATNRDLDAEVESGRFRADLLARLSAWRIVIPPLRMRREDILPLAKVFLAAHARLGLLVEAAESLLLDDWPFNVRGLEQAVVAAAIRAEDEKAPAIAVRHLPSPIRGGGRNASVERQTVETESATIEEVERRFIEGALRSHSWNIVATARAIGVSRGLLYRKISKFGLKS